MIDLIETSDDESEAEFFPSIDESENQTESSREWKTVEFSPPLKNDRKEIVSFDEEFLNGKSTGRFRCSNSDHKSFQGRDKKNGVFVTIKKQNFRRGLEIIK